MAVCRFRSALSFAVVFSFGLSARGEINLIAQTSFPGDSVDRSGLKAPENRLGGQGSGIAYTGVGNRFVLLSDRGWIGDRTFKTRFHVMDIRVTGSDKPALKADLIATVLLKDEQGRNFIGDSAAFDADHPGKSLRLDPEGIRVGRTGTVFISDEFGPYMWEFSMAGKRLRAFKVPQKFLIARPSAKAKDELPPSNKSGRVPNKGMEALAISPDGSKLYGLMQNALIQDGGDDESGKKPPINNRLLELDIGTGKTREFVYQIDHGANGVCEIVAINDHEFLVLERDGKGAGLAKDKKIYRIDITDASDVSNIPSLPARELPSDIKPVAKKLFIDLLSPKFKLAGPDMPAKIEGLAFGPDLPDGRHLLLVATDNDFIETQSSIIYAFAIDPADLPGYQPQRFDLKK